MPFRRGLLGYFVVVAQEGQITRAAAKLHMTQPSLSQAITQLEDELGLQLFERHARGVSLTSAGERFYAKAALAVTATAEVQEAANALVRAELGTIALGFVGAPPGLDSPRALEAFSRAHPRIDIRYRELPFPSAPTTAWLAEVDVAVCHTPPAHPRVWTEPLRSEPRVVLAPRRHPLADAGELDVADVVDQTFIGMNSSVETSWAGFWSLDDHRGGPPANVTSDRASNAQEVLAALAVRPAITTVPASVAALIPNASSDLVTIPLRDAAPTTIVLAGDVERRNAPVDALAAFARGADSGIARTSAALAADSHPTPAADSRPGRAAKGGAGSAAPG